MRFKHQRTGVVIELTTPNPGGLWELYEPNELPTIEEPTIAEPVIEEIEEEPVEVFDLTSMSVAELKQYAKDNDIELTGTKKAEIIKDIALAFEG